jgi:hypothetical protein
VLRLFLVDKGLTLFYDSEDRSIRSSVSPRVIVDVEDISSEMPLVDRLEQLASKPSVTVARVETTGLMQ